MSRRRKKQKTRSPEGTKPAQKPARPQSEKPKRIWILPFIFAAQVALLGLFYYLAFRYARDPELVAGDVVTLPGETITLRARVRQDLPPLLQIDMSGREIVFELLAPPEDVESPKRLESTTEKDGVARVAWNVPKQTGRFRFRARLKNQGTGTEKTIDTEFAIHPISPDSNLVITTVGQTLWESALRKAPAGSDASDAVVRKPKAKAIEVLRGLSADHTVVYLDLASGINPEKTRTWLSENRFPTGPVLPLRIPEQKPSEAWKSIRDFVNERIKTKWKRISWAFCSGRDDMEPRASELKAFVSCDLRTIIIDALTPPGEDGVRVFQAVNWEKAGKIIGRR